MSDGKAKGPGGKGFTPNPVFSRVIAAGGEGSVALTGYVVESTRENHLRMLFGLDELSDSVEVSLDDVVEIAELSSFDLGASVVWVRRGALVHHGVSLPVEDFVTRWRSAQQLTIKRQGLRMRTPLEARRAPTCEYICDGTHCVPCTCNCLRQ
jgi:hypothetical protein